MLWLTAIGRLANAAAKWQERKDDATTERERIYAETKIAQINAQMEMQTRGEATWLPKLARALAFAPIILYLWKLIIFDKVIGSLLSDTPFRTDGLSPELWNISMLMLGFYFGVPVAEKMIARIWK